MIHRFAPSLMAVTLALAAATASAQKTELQPGDFIAAVVNQDVVAASEVIQRTEKLRAEARQRGEVMPETAGLRKQALESLIEDRVLVTYARENGVKMPSFFGYMAWSSLVLLPTFLLVTWIFF